MIQYKKDHWILIDGTTEQVLEDLKMLFDKGIVDVPKIRCAEIRLNRKHPKKYPLTLSGNGVVIKLSNMSFGDTSEQSKGTLKALMLAGFYIPKKVEENIFSSKVRMFYFFKHESAAN